MVVASWLVSCQTRSAISPTWRIAGVSVIGERPAASMSIGDNTACFFDDAIIGLTVNSPTWNTLFQGMPFQLRLVFCSKGLKPCAVLLAQFCLYLEC